MRSLQGRRAAWRAPARAALLRCIPCLLALAGALHLGTGSADAQTSAQHAAIDSLFAEWDRTSSPGCALGITRDGALTYARGYGMADLDHGVPLAPSSVFYLASVSKQFTAAAVALAAQQGHLSLDDDLRRWFPELPEYGRTITVRNLVHHTSGIRDYLELMPLAGMRYADVLTDDELLGLITRQKGLNFEPGSQYLYSNSGYILLAELVERATGLTLRAFAREHLFEPLGMYDTHFHDDASEVVRNRAIGYQRGPDGLRMNHLWNFDKVGDGGLYSTVEDLARWEANFLEPRVGGATLLNQILQRGVLSSGDTLPYAFALSHGEYRRVPTLEHGGALMAFRTNFLRFPEQRAAVIVLCNTPANPSQLSRRVADIALADMLGPPQAAAGGDAGAEPFIELPPEDMARRAGLYRDAATGRAFRLDAETGQLQRRVTGPSVAFRATSPASFRSIDYPVDVRLEFPAEDRVTVRVGGGAPTEYRRVRPAALSAAALQAYAGHYHSEELDASYEVGPSEDGALIVRGPLGNEVRLEATLTDEFANESRVVKFLRDGARISGFVLDGGRVKGLRFERR